MTRCSPGARVALVALLALAGAMPAVAQSQGSREGSGGSSGDGQERSWAGLAPGRSAGSGFNASVDLFGGYNVATLAPWNVPEGDVEPADTDWTGGFGGANAWIGYANSGESVAFSTGGSANVRYYPDSTASAVPGYSAFAQVGQAGNRFSWQLGQNAAYGPVNALQVFPGGATGIGGLPLVDYQLTDTEQATADTTATLGYGLSRNGRLSFSGAYGLTDTTDADATTPPQRFDRRSAGARYSYQTTRYASIYAGYGYATTRLLEGPADTAPSPVIQNFDLGVSYARPLSFSRRTSIAFQMGGTAIENPSSPRQYTAVGSASIQREIGRTWTSRLLFSRDVRFIPAVFEPVTSNGLTAQAVGLLSQRASLQFVANYASGDVGSGPGGDFTAYSASAQLRYSFGAYISSYAEYFFLQSTLGSGISLPAGLDQDSRSNGVRVGMTVGNLFSGLRR